MKLLITGATGFVGRNLADTLRGAHEVLAPTRAELDLLEAEATGEYLKRHAVDVVIHSASERSNRRLAPSSGLLNRNCRMFFNLARHTGRFGRLLFLSSGAIYDRAHSRPRMGEDYFDQYVPSDDYGFSKYVCAKSIRPEGNIYELRLFGVFGPYEDWQVRFISNACCRAVWDLPVVIRQNVLFDYLDVADLGRIVSWFLDAQPRHRHYNVCSGRTSDLKTLATYVVRVARKKLPVVVHNDGMGVEYSGDNTRLVEEFRQFRPRALEDSVAALYSWYLERKESIDPTLLHFDA